MAACHQRNNKHEDGHHHGPWTPPKSITGHKALLKSINPG